MIFSLGLIFKGQVQAAVVSSQSKLFEEASRYPEVDPTSEIVTGEEHAYCTRSGRR